jgi:hypothetical protein
MQALPRHNSIALAVVIPIYMGQSFYDFRRTYPFFKLWIYLWFYWDNLSTKIPMVTLDAILKGLFFFDNVSPLQRAEYVGY